MNTSYGEWTQCKDCIYFDDCITKESEDGCYFGNSREEEKISISETIDIKKYINALNNLLGSDNAYYAGDPDVDAIMEVIMLAKKLDKRVKELTEEKGVIMIYIIYKDTNYQDFGNKRIDIGHYYIEERNMTNPKDIALFGSKCCEEFLKKDVFFDDKIGAYTECAKRNKDIIESFLTNILGD